MTNVQHITRADPAGTGAADGFELDVTLVEVGDTAGLVSLTDDGCGETCGACTTNVA
ncbi:MAG: FxLD family lantipeptide [Catenulispora sp.]|nr:FxLD family lantipeptide [Catenulispora sp.]